MALIYSQAATATVAANANVLTVSGMDLNAVLAGMVINLGARDRVTGDGYIIATVAPSGSNGGTLTTVGAIPSAFANAPFVIDTRDFNGTAPNYLIAMYTLVLTTLLRLTSPLTNLFSGSRVLALDKDSAGAVSRLLYAIGGRTWFGAEQRTLSYTPTGGTLTSAETFGLRAFPDGTLPVDAVMIDLTTGGVDMLAASATMVSAAMVDLASAPMMKVAISGGAQIASFGAGKHKVREVHFVDGGNVLVHNAASLILPGRENITTVAGDTLRATSDASGNWRVRSYDRADGTPLAIGGLSFRNRLINGNFAVNQRGAASASTSYAAGAYVMDRWKAGANGCTLSFVASGSDVIVTITAGTLLQVIEGSRYLPEGGAYSLSWSGTATARVYQGTANGAYAASPVAAAGLTVGTNTTIEFGTGTVSLAQFEPGTAASRFERRDDELRRCQRYYETSYQGFTKPGTASARAGGVGLFYTGSAVTGGGIYARFAERKRTSPTVQVYSPSDGAVGQFFDYAATVNRAASLDLNSEYGFRVYNNTLPSAGIVLLETQFTADAEL